MENNKNVSYNSWEVQRNLAMKKAALKTAFIVISVLYVVFTIVALIGYNSQLSKKNEENENLKRTIITLEQNQKKYLTKINYFDNQLSLLDVKIDNMENRFIDVTQNQLDKLSYDGFENYNYAMKPTKYNKYYLNEHQMKLVLDYSEKYKLDPNLVLGVMWVESRYYPKAKSKSSSASGYGQFIKSTGEWTHYYLLKRKDKYNHKINPFNPDDAIPMMCAYLNHLVIRNKGDIRTVLIRYNGNELGKKYYQMIDEYFDKVIPGVSLDSIEENIKNKNNF